MDESPSVDESLLEYRAHLVTARQKALEDYDKTVVSLSGGALGVSFVFLKDFVGAAPIRHPGWLFLAWVFWGLSISAVLFSFFTSNVTLRRAISQVDAETARDKQVGGRFRVVTDVLNIAGGVLFLAGVILMALFVWYNLEVINVRQR